MPGDRIHGRPSRLLDADAAVGAPRRRRVRRHPQPQPAPPAGGDGARTGDADADHPAHPADTVAGVGHRRHRRGRGPIRGRQLLYRRGLAAPRPTSPWCRNGVDGRRWPLGPRRDPTWSGSADHPGEGAAPGHRMRHAAPVARWSSPDRYRTPSTSPEMSNPSWAARSATPGTSTQRELAHLVGASAAASGHSDSGTNRTGWWSPRR